MNQELKFRTVTSIVLLFFLFLIFISSNFLIILLFISSILALTEFFYLMDKIFNNKKYLQMLTNLVFISYIFLFSLFFYIFTLNFGLKVLIFFCLLCCILSDIGGFVFGKFFKGKKLTKISPNKTISGSIGSFVFVTVFSIIISTTVLDVNMIFRLIFLSLLTSLGCQIGDIFFSFLKRKAKIKDTGNLLPGHGGILDRLDGILLGMPFSVVGIIIFFLLTS